MGLEITGNPALDTILRLGLAALLGGLIGMDREASGKPAGFRTNILICVGAALLTELSIDIADRWVRVHGTVADPERIAAQIVTGIGFLGAGTIIQSRLGVRGLTTAATIWVVAGIGMAVGGGSYLLALTATVGVMITLALLARFEAWIDPRTMDERWVRVQFRKGSGDRRTEVERLFRERDAHIRSRDIERRDDGLRASYRLKARSRAFEGLIDDILRDEAVTRATLE